MLRLLIYIFVVVLGTFGQVEAQKTMKELKAIQNSEDRVDSTLETSWHYLSKYKWEKARQFAEYANESANQIKNQLNIAESYMHLGLIAMYEDGEYEMAADYFNKAYNIRVKEKKPLLAIRACNNLIGLYNFQGKFDESERVCLNGLKLLKNLDENNKDVKDVKARFESLVGTTYTKWGQPKKAVIYLESSLKLRKELQNKKEILKTLLSIGTIYSEEIMRDYTSALKYFEEGYNYAVEVKDTVHQGKFLIALADVYLATGKLDKGAEMQQKAFLIENKLETPEKLLLRLGKGKLLFELGKVELALKQWLEIEADFEAQGDDNALAYLLMNIGMAYLQMENLPKADEYLTDAYDIAVEMDNSVMEMAMLKPLIDYNYKIKNFKRATELGKIASYIQDSISNLALDAMSYKVNINDFTLDAMSYKVKLVELEKANMTLQNQRLGLVVLFLVIIAGYFFYRANSAKKKQEQLAVETENLIQKQELDLVYERENGKNQERERIAQDLHDGLGGLLSSMKLQVAPIERKLEASQQSNLKEFEKIYSIIDESVIEVRRISHNLISNTLKEYGLEYIVEELAEQIRNSRQIEVNVDTHGMEARLDKTLESKLYRIIQELITNTLKHAKAEKIDIGLNKFDNVINFMIEDNGVGFNLDMVRAKNKGIGLDGIERKVKELGGTIDIDTAVRRGTMISIDIPVKDSYS